MVSCTGYLSCTLRGQQTHKSVLACFWTGFHYILLVAGNQLFISFLSVSVLISFRLKTLLVIERVRSREWSSLIIRYCHYIASMLFELSFILNIFNTPTWRQNAWRNFHRIILFMTIPWLGWINCSHIKALSIPRDYSSKYRTIAPWVPDPG